MISPSKPTRLIAPVLALLVLAGVALSPAEAAQAAQTDDGSVTWSVRTAANEFGAERTGYHYTITPGYRVDDGIVVTNGGTAPLDLAVYAADGFTTSSGQFDLLAGDEKSKNIGAWTTSAKHVVVQPGASSEVPFSVVIPKDAPPGDYAGGIVTSLVTPDAAQQVNVDRRLGIRISLRVTGDLKPSLAVTDAHVDVAGEFDPFGGGSASFDYTIRNTGNAVVSARQSEQLSGPFGWFAAKPGKHAETPQLLPGESWRVHVPFPQVATAFVAIGTTTVTPIVTDASGSTEALEPVVVSGAAPAIPWTWLIVLLVLAAIVVTALRLVPRIRARRIEREEARVQEAVALALAGKEPEAARSR
jgi:amino acid transporter